MFFWFLNRVNQDQELSKEGLLKSMKYLKVEMIIW